MFGAALWRHVADEVALFVFECGPKQGEDSAIFRAIRSPQIRRSQQKQRRDVSEWSECGADQSRRILARDPTPKESNSPYEFGMYMPGQRLEGSDAPRSCQERGKGSADPDWGGAAEARAPVSYLGRGRAPDVLPTYRPLVASAVGDAVGRIVHGVVAWVTCWNGQTGEGRGATIVATIAIGINGSVARGTQELRAVVYAAVRAAIAIRVDGAAPFANDGPTGRLLAGVHASVTVRVDGLSYAACKGLAYRYGLAGIDAAVTVGVNRDLKIAARDHRRALSVLAAAAAFVGKELLMRFARNFRRGASLDGVNDVFLAWVMGLVVAGGNTFVLAAVSIGINGFVAIEWFTRTGVGTAFVGASVTVDVVCDLSGRARDGWALSWTAALVTTVLIAIHGVCPFIA